MAAQPKLLILAITIIASSGLLVSACKAKAGDTCHRDGVCDGKGGGALVCVSNTKKYVAATCRGPDGCVSSPVFRCDFRENAAGDPCVDGEMRPMYCTQDKKARVRCSADGRVERDECNGPRGCFPKPNTETTMGCDRTLSAGAPCSIDGDWCSDGTADNNNKDWLTCTKGKLVVAAKCRGPGGCKPFDESIACDVSIAEIGDPCIAGSTAAAAACSVDHTKVLACENGVIKLATSCAAGKPCSISKDGASCAK